MLLHFVVQIDVYCRLGRRAHRLHASRLSYPVHFSSFFPTHSHVASPPPSLSFIQEIRNCSGRSVEIYSQLLKRYLIELAVHELMPVIFHTSVLIFMDEMTFLHGMMAGVLLLSGEPGY